MTKVEKIERQIENLQAELEKAKSSKRIACDHCNKKTQLSNLTYLQTHYEKDGGYCIGTRIVPGEGQYVCPKCGEINCLSNRPEIEDLKWSFGKIEDIDD